MKNNMAICAADATKQPQLIPSPQSVCRMEIFMILADYHIHTNFSTDSDTAPRAQIEKAIELGLKEICFTDHMDYDFPTGEFVFSIEDYLRELRKLKKEFKDKISIKIGVELGLQPNLKLPLDFYNHLDNLSFDFIIGSTHLINKMDPYYPEFWQGKTESECYREYFEETLKNIKKFDCFDVYGHIDYIARYAPSKNKNNTYSYEAYSDILDEILSTLIAKQKGIECNTAGFKYGLNHPNPEAALIKRYIELGGKIITIGSDGHKPKYLAYDFYKIPDILKSCNVKYYTVFENRIPKFIPIDK